MAINMSNKEKVNGVSVNKRQKIKVCIIVLVSVMITAGFIAFFFSFFYLPNQQMYYDKINSVVLPDDAQVLSTTVERSDVYGDHVCAEKVIGTKMDYDELDDFLQKNNSGRLNKYISLLNVKKDGDGYDVEWDDYCSEPNVIIGNERDGYFYYILSCDTPYGSIYYI